MRKLGDIGDKDTENEVLLLEHDVPHSAFSEAVLACLPKLPWLITGEVGSPLLENNINMVEPVLKDHPHWPHKCGLSRGLSRQVVFADRFSNTGMWDLLPRMCGLSRQTDGLS